MDKYIRKIKNVRKRKNKKIKTLQTKVLRQAKTIRGLMAILHEKKLLSSELAAVLERNFEL